MIVMMTKKTEQGTLLIYYKADLITRTFQYFIHESEFSCAHTMGQNFIPSSKFSAQFNYEKLELQNSKVYKQLKTNSFM